MPLFKICLLGAESTGKSSLAVALAEALRSHGYWAQALPEALRVFCERRRRLPLVADESIIFSAQKKAELAAHGQEDEPRFLLCDSAPLLTAFTSHWYFGDSSLLEAGLAHQASYLHCYLSEPSLAWEADGILRDGPAARAKFHADLLKFLRQCSVSYESIALKPNAVFKNSRQAKAMATEVLVKAGLPWNRLNQTELPSHSQSPPA
jgi:nicotinamide riboside kinase